MNRYEASAVLTKGWWAVTVVDVAGHDIYTQGRTLQDAERMAADAVAAVLDADVSAVRVTVTPMLDDEVSAALAARQRAAEADDAARDTRAAAVHQTRVAARRLVLDHGLSQREAAGILGISHQRVAQLVREAMAS